LKNRTAQKSQTRQRIVDAAGRGFRSAGFGGIGVDGLAKEAGVTSGAFYVHFGSKAEAFRATITQGLEELKAGVLHFQGEHSGAWWPEFVRFYLGYKRTCAMADSCTLQSLAPEAARADAAAQTAFAAGMRDVAEAIIAGPASPAAPRTLEAACVALSALVGAVTLGRAVGPGEMGQQIAEATERALLRQEI
jgi:TetR/AcrR family transcriptional regulator, transcriptional repressor for nem operon